MATSGGSPVSGAFVIACDTIIGTIAGGLVVLVFYPLTLCAFGIKSAVRTMRPHLVSHRNPHITGTH